jgi:hypothetical protein
MLSTGAAQIAPRRFYLQLSIADKAQCVVVARGDTLSRERVKPAQRIFPHRLSPSLLQVD